MKHLKKRAKLFFSKTAYLASKTPLKKSKLLKKVYNKLNNSLNEKLLDYEAITTYNGFDFVVNPSELVGRVIYFNKSGYEEDIDELIQKEVGEKDTVLDIGANIGVHTMRMAQSVEGKGSVIAFEPDPVNLERLKRNIKLNEFENVETLEKACSNENGTTEILRFEKN